MTEEQLISIIPLFRGSLKEATKALALYPEIHRIDIGVIRKLLGYSGTPLKVNATPDILDEMIELYKNGEGTLRSLSAKYHVAPKTFQRALHKKGFDTSRQDTWSTFKEKKFLKCIEDGMTYANIAKLFNISPSAVSQKAHRLGIPHIKHGHSNKIAMSTKNIAK